jgi:hypothetical protein
VSPLDGFTCGRCHRWLEWHEHAHDPDPEGREDRFLCKLCWAALMLRRKAVAK